MSFMMRECTSNSHISVNMCKVSYRWNDMCLQVERHGKVLRMRNDMGFVFCVGGTTWVPHSCRWNDMGDKKLCFPGLLFHVVPPLKGFKKARIRNDIF